MSADITGFEVQYKNNLAAIGFHKAMTAEDEVCTRRLGKTV
jgi:hypothetical protein